jgi:hypothetical protein
MAVLNGRMHVEMKNWNSRREYKKKNSHFANGLLFGGRCKMIDGDLNTFALAFAITIQSSRTRRLCDHDKPCLEKQGITSLENKLLDVEYHEPGDQLREHQDIHYGTPFIKLVLLLEQTQSASGFLHLFLDWIRLLAI